ncbi:MAG: hypothetical protein LBR93_07900 [Treponema sp.]|jgi:hypothetical protein|nr:hypothetical protein [Treponema sp.]
MKQKVLLAGIFGMTLGFGCASTGTLNAQNSLVLRTTQAVPYTLRDSVDTVGNKYIGYGSRIPSVMTYVQDDGSVSVCGVDENQLDTCVYEYSKDMKLMKTLKFHNELKTLGAFTKDAGGNYYFFYGEAVKKDEPDRENMALVKYDRSGGKQKTYKLKAYADNSFHGIRVPFDASGCRLEISGTIIAVYFGREMFNGHQASYGFVLNTDTFERVDKGATTNSDTGGNFTMPYVSHSFNQYILPIKDGLIFADHGDAYPRSFSFAQFQNNGRGKRLHAFQFEGPIGQNATFAQLGGVAKTPMGYMFAGTYGKKRDSSRNMLLLLFDEDLTACSGPVWITNYTQAAGHAAHPKIAALDAGRYLLMWEVCAFSTQSANSITATPTEHRSTYMLIVDEQGTPLTRVTELPNIRLNMDDVLRYNKTTGNVYWSVNDGRQSIVTYTLNPRAVRDLARGERPQAAAEAKQWREEETARRQAEEARLTEEASTWDVSRLETRADYLSAIERELVLELNKIRSNPQAYARLYITNKAGGAYTKLAAAQGLPLMALEKGLCLAARESGNVFENANKYGKLSGSSSSSTMFGGYATGKEIALGFADRYSEYLVNAANNHIGIAVLDDPKWGVRVVFVFTSKYVSDL